MILVTLKKKVFQFFLSFSKFRPSRVHWAPFFREKPQNKFKTCLDTFGNVFGYLEFREVFAFLWNFSTSLPSRVHWPKNFEKITSKHVWTILETFLDNFKNLNSFPFLWNFFESPGCTGQRVFPSKKSSKTCLNKVFGNVLGEFWKFRSFSTFLCFLRVSTTQFALGTNFTETITSKQVQNMFDCFWERFLGILKNWKFSSFLVFLQVLTLQGALGMFFRKNHLKTISKLVWTLSGTFLDTFEISNFFRFFFRIFPSFDHRGCTGQIFLPKKLPRSIIKTCLSFSGNVFGHFEKKTKVFPFFWCFSMFRPSRVHWAIFFSEKYLKTSSKLVWKLLRTFLDTFRNSNFFDFFSIFSKFRPSRVHWTKNFDKITSKHVWTLLVTILDTFEISNCFRFFFELFQVSTLQGELVNFFHQKNYLGACWKRVWTLLGKILVILDKKIEFFNFS